MNVGFSSGVDKDRKKLAQFILPKEIQRDIGEHEIQGMSNSSRYKRIRILLTFDISARILRIIT